MMEIGQPKETELSELDDKTRRLRQKRMWSVKEKQAEPKALWDARSRAAGALRKPQTWREEGAGRTPEETAQALCKSSGTGERRERTPRPLGYYNETGNTQRGTRESTKIEHISPQESRRPAAWLHTLPVLKEEDLPARNLTAAKAVLQNEDTPRGAELGK